MEFQRDAMRGEGTRAVIYVRVSTEAQESGFSPQVQVDDGRRMAASLGDPDPLVIQETASGARADRQGFSELLRLIERGSVQYVLSWALDRISRDMVEGARFLQVCQTHGVHIYDTKNRQQVPLENLLWPHIQIAFGVNERAQFRERSVKNKAKRFAEGHPWWHPPYGYRFVRDRTTRGDKGHWEIVEAHALVIREVFARYLKGEVPAQIARGLNASGVPLPPQRPGRPAASFWQAQAISRMLRQTDYDGRHIVNRKRYVRLDLAPGQPHATYRGKARRDATRIRDPQEWREMPVPAILDPGVFAQAQTIRAQRLNGRPRARRNDALLRGLLFCAADGLGMSLARNAQGNQPLYYKCSRFQWEKTRRHAQQATEHCMDSLPAPWLDALVWEWVSRLFRPGSPVPAALTALTDPAHTADALHALDVRMTALRARLAELAAAQRRLEAALAYEGALDLHELMRQRNDLITTTHDTRTVLDQVAHERAVLAGAEAISHQEWDFVCQKWPAVNQELSLASKRKLLYSFGPTFRVIYQPGSSRILGHSVGWKTARPAIRTPPAVDLWGELPFERPLRFRLTAGQLVLLPPPAGDAPRPTPPAQNHETPRDDSRTPPLRMQDTPDAAGRGGPLVARGLTPPVSWGCP